MLLQRVRPPLERTGSDSLCELPRLFCSSLGVSPDVWPGVEDLRDAECLCRLDWCVPYNEPVNLLELGGCRRQLAERI